MVRGVAHDMVTITLARDPMDGQLTGTPHVFVTVSEELDGPKPKQATAMLTPSAGRRLQSALGALTALVPKRRRRRHG
jgi:hypothetical protein